MKIKKRHLDQFSRIATRLDRLMEEIKKYCPEANLYAEDSDNLNLMSGPTHTKDRYLSPIYENVARHARVRSLGGGGW